MCTSLPEAGLETAALLSISWVAFTGIAQVQKLAGVAIHQHGNTTPSVHCLRQ